MHSAPDYSLDAGKVVLGVVVSVILICATSVKELKILVDGSKKAGETLHAARAVTSELSTSEESSQQHEA